MDPIVRAVDVGRGNTKYIADIKNGDHAFKCVAQHLT